MSPTRTSPQDTRTDWYLEHWAPSPPAPAQTPPMYLLDPHHRVSYHMIKS